VKALRIALPWLTALAVLGFLFQRIDARATWSALAGADVVHYAALACVFSLVWLGIDAAVLARLFGPLGAKLRWAEMVRERAATYPLMIVSFHLASAALVARLARHTRARLSTLGGGMLVHYVADLAALCSVSLAGTLLLDTALAVALRPVLALLALGAGGLLAAGRLARRVLADRPVVDALAALTSADLAWVVAGRCAWYASFSVFVWTTAPCFDLAFSAGDVAARMPIVLAVAALPIAPAGIGTAQAALLALFSDLGPEPRLFAYGLVFGATSIVLRLPLGALALWRESALAHGEAS
jgi:hypothetical protein